MQKTLRHHLIRVEFQQTFAARLARRDIWLEKGISVRCQLSFGVGYCAMFQAVYRGCACDVTNRMHVMHTAILSVNCKKQRALLSFVSCTAQ